MEVTMTDGSPIDASVYDREVLATPQQVAQQAITLAYHVLRAPEYRHSARDRAVAQARLDLAQDFLASLTQHKA